MEILALSLSPVLRLLLSVTVLVHPQLHSPPLHPHLAPRGVLEIRKDNSPQTRQQQLSLLLLATAVSSREGLSEDVLSAPPIRYVPHFS